MHPLVVKDCKMKTLLISQNENFYYNLMIYTLLTCAKQAKHTHTPSGGRLSGECIVTGLLKNKIMDGMTV